MSEVRKRSAATQARRAQVVDFLRQHPGATAAILSERFGVSENAARRDLDHALKAAPTIAPRRHARGPAGPATYVSRLLEDLESAIKPRLEKAYEGQDVLEALRKVRAQLDAGLQRARWKKRSGM